MNLIEFNIVDLTKLVSYLQVRWALSTNQPIDQPTQCDTARYATKKVSGGLLQSYYFLNCKGKLNPKVDPLPSGLLSNHILPHEHP